MTPKKMSKQRLRYNYLRKERNWNRKSESTIRRIEQSLNRLDVFMGDRPYVSFNEEDAKALKRSLGKPSNEPDKDIEYSGGAISTLRQIQAFLSWLGGQPGYRKLASGVVEYLAPSDREKRAKQSTQYSRIPTYEEVRRVLELSPRVTAIERRNRAIIAFLSLVPVRDGAVIGLKLKHVSLEEKLVRFPANELKTKRGKNLNCVFLPVGKDIEEVFVSWITERLNISQDPDAPVFPKTDVGPGQSKSFSVQGLSKEHWTGTSSIRTIVRESFKLIGRGDVIPHQFRHMILDYMRDRGLSVAELKALSQSFGHDSITTTMDTYGAMSKERQVSIMRSVYENAYSQPTEKESTLEREIAEALERNKKRGTNVSTLNSR